MDPSLTISLVNTQKHLSAVNYLKNIYTLEDENKVASVFFEFIESKSRDKANDYMERVCYEASKMDLYPDQRTPEEAQKGFCFGFKARKGENVPQLIKSVESAMTYGSPAKYEVPLTPINALMLEHNLRKMPAKDYGEVFCSDYHDQWS